jgi:hypothetical protein
MITMGASRKAHWVVLDKPKPEDEGLVLTPSRMFVAIEPTPPGAFDEQKITHIVTCEYHPDITLNTRITTEGGRHLWVRGIQDREFRHIELVLLCEEVLTP